MLRGNIAATSLKMLLKNLYSVKCYDKLNMYVFTLSQWENFWWGLIYFDQFTIMHQSFVFTAPSYRESGGIAGLRCSANTFDCPRSAGEIRGS